MPHYFGPPAERRSSRYDAIEEAARADMVCEPTYQAAKVTRNLVSVMYLHELDWEPRTLHITHYTLGS